MNVQEKSDRIKILEAQVFLIDTHFATGQYHPKSNLFASLSYKKTELLEEIQKLKANDD